MCDKFDGLSPSRRGGLNATTASFAEQGRPPSSDDDLLGETLEGRP
jgi:hypothetical protein